MRPSTAEKKRLVAPSSVGIRGIASGAPAAIRANKDVRDAYLGEQEATDA